MIWRCCVEDSTFYFARMATAGGGFKRLAESGMFLDRPLLTDGTNYVAEARHSRRADEPECTLVEGRLLDQASKRLLASVPARDDTTPFRGDCRAWDATATTVYLGYDNRLYRIARQF